MKVEVHIDSHFQEEGVTITAPTLYTRVERIRDFVEELDLSLIHICQTQGKCTQ